MFHTSPINLGVESELYTRFGDGDAKDTSIEAWFAEAIDDPASAMLEHLLDPSNIRRNIFCGDHEKAQRYANEIMPSLAQSIRARSA